MSNDTLSQIERLLGELKADADERDSLRLTVCTLRSFVIKVRRRISLPHDLHVDSMSCLRMSDAALDLEDAA